MGVFSDLADERQTFSPLLHLLLPELALAVLVGLRLPLPIKLAASVALLAYIVYILTCTTTGTARDNYAIGSAVLGNTFFSTILFVWFTDPMVDFRYLSDEGPSLSSRSIYQRLYNSICIIRNNRLIGWNVQVPNVPPPIATEKMSFIRRRLQQLFWTIVLTDLTESFIYPYRHLYDVAFVAPGTTGYALRSWCTLVWLVMTYAILKLYYVLGSLLAVALGISRPEVWPDTFGKWEDAYTLRRLWGRTWHQNLRRHFSHWGKLIVCVLRIPRGTWLSSQAQLHTAFALSALIHGCGDLMLAPHARYFGRSFPFFAANALAIALEDSILVIAQRILGHERAARWDAKNSRVGRVAGYVWVVLAMSIIAPMYVGWMFEANVVLEPVLHPSISPVQTYVLPWIQKKL